MKYNHMYDIAFAIDTDVEDAYKVPREVLIAGLLERIAHIVESNESTDCFGHCDSYVKEEIMTTDEVKRHYADMTPEDYQKERKSDEGIED